MKGVRMFQYKMFISVFLSVYCFRDCLTFLLFDCSISCLTSLTYHKLNIMYVCVSNVVNVNNDEFLYYSFYIHNNNFYYYLLLLLFFIRLLIVEIACTPLPRSYTVRYSVGYDG